MGSNPKTGYSWDLAKHKTHPGEICLLAYLDHELSPDAYPSFKKHLNDCMACRETLASLKMASRMFEELIRKSNETERRVEIPMPRQVIRDP